MARPTSRTARTRTANRWARTRCGALSNSTAGIRMRRSACRPRCRRISPPASAAAAAQWERTVAAYRTEHPALASQIDCMQRRELPDDWDGALPSFPADAKGMATRDASGKALNAIAAVVPWLLGGAADLAPATKTHLDFVGAGEFEAPGGGGA